MMDEIFDREYQHGRAQLNSGLDRLFSRIGKATAATFNAVSRIQYDAPWQERRRGGRHA